MNDLEYAAKACGIKISFDARGAYQVIDGMSGNDKTWNPRTDDGDSFRLAVKLRIDIDWFLNRVRASFSDTNRTHRWVDFNPVIKDDDLRACREAVFAVAVQIGRSME